MTEFDTIIIGAGAAGMMCAAHARGRVLVIERARAPREKIRISGGGRCNFTNLGCGPENFLSQNPHFAKSALSRYSQTDFIDLIGRHNISWHEKTLGQLFCDGSARQIVALLLAEMQRAGAELRLETSVCDIIRTTDGFGLTLNPGGRVACKNLVVACGGKSIPKMGGSGFGYEVARQFGLKLAETPAALVPFTFSDDILAGLKPLAGIALDCAVRCGGAPFEEAVLFT
ncbi:MAG: aminoacetone oxidase family FAD-binding enzyme, partial [Paracoccaceae bacterium]